MPVAGAGATAVGCAILGLKTQAVTTVGDDEMGDFLVAKMEKFGVHCHMVARDGSVRLFRHNPSGAPERRTAGPTMFPEPWRRSRCRRTSSMPRSTRGLCMSEARAFSRVSTVSRVSPCSVAPRRFQRTTTFDFIQATPETFAFVKPTLPYVDYFVPSIEEASEMAGRADPQKVAQFYKDLGAQNVLLTMGGNGVYVLRESDEAFQLRAHAIKVVDTTGRGDSFTAGIIVGLVHDRTLKEWGAACVDRRGKGCDGFEFGRQAQVV